MEQPMNTGLSATVSQSLRDTISQFNGVKAAYLFGSRARGDWTAHSDIDIAIDAPTMLEAEFAQLWNAIDALPIAFPIDCIWLQATPPSPLRTMIERDAKPLMVLQSN
jgi:uncharacterized protein